MPNTTAMTRVEVAEALSNLGNRDATGPERERLADALKQTPDPDAVRHVIRDAVETHRPYEQYGPDYFNDWLPARMTARIGGGHTFVRCEPGDIVLVGQAASDFPHGPPAFTVYAPRVGWKVGHVGAHQFRFVGVPELCDVDGCYADTIDAYTPDDDPDGEFRFCRSHVTEAGFANYAQWVQHREDLP